MLWLLYYFHWGMIIILCKLLFSLMCLINFILCITMQCARVISTLKFNMLVETFDKWICSVVCSLPYYIFILIRNHNKHAIIIHAPLAMSFWKKYRAYSYKMFIMHNSFCLYIEQSWRLPSEIRQHKFRTEMFMK